MNITFSNNAGIRSMSWNKGADLLLPWLTTSLPDAADDLLPPTRYVWIHGDPYHDLLSEVRVKEAETAALQTIAFIYCGTLTSLSPRDGSSLARFLRQAAASRDRSADAVEDWRLLDDLRERAAALRSLADFFDSEPTTIAVSKRDDPEEDPLEHLWGEPSAPFVSDAMPVVALSESR